MTAIAAAPPRPVPTWVGAAGYAGLLAAGVGLFLLVRSAGVGLTAPPAPPDAVRVGAATAGQVDVVFHVVATIAAVVGLGYVLGRLCRRVGQPAVVGEVMAGIVLGPSLLGAVWPDAMHLLIPSAAADPKGQVGAAVKAVAQLGVILYMFLVGLELNAGHLRGKAHAAVAVSHASIVVPFVLGAGLALVLYPRVSHAGVPFTSFALFMGAALAVTAFPVLARILADRGMERTPLGVTALGCAAADDATAWSLLALVTAVARAETTGAAGVGPAAAAGPAAAPSLSAAGEVWGALAVVGGAVAYGAFMLVVARPLLARLAARLDARPGPLPPAAVSGLFVLVLLSALATEAIGIHAVFGAFVLGAVLPHDGRLARELSAKLKDPVTVLFLPAFFAYSGMRTEIGLLAGWEDWLLCGAIVLAATVGKFASTLFAARLAGESWRTAAALGALMNTRGLMGLIVLDVGLSLGVMSPRLFAMMVLMAVATTLLTAPALKLLAPERPTH
jgi:Kef-type K+ transport system membrane component KefB